MFYRWLPLAAVMLVFFCAALLSLPVAAQNAGGIYQPVQTTPQDLAVIAEGQVVEVVKPDLIRLDNDRLYVIDNIRVPVLYSDAALTWLDQTLLNRPVVLRANPTIGPGGKDRMGNQTAHIVRKEDNLWIQQAMVAEGLAWADSTRTNRDLAVPLLQTEETARSGQKGFWSAPGMLPRLADKIGAERDAFMVVEGRVMNTADKKKIFFINFGEDWKTDFTLALRAENVASFPEGFTVASLQGKNIRMRGWVSERNGPMMDLTHAEQIEILEPTTGPAAATP